MKEITGNIWDYKDKDWIVIMVNGMVKKNGENVMGKGIAAQAKMLFPDLPLKLGDSILHNNGNHVHIFSEYNIITFPTKYRFYEDSDIELIERSAKELTEVKKLLIEGRGDNRDFYLVRSGCGSGRLSWLDVKPILEKYFDDSYIIVSPR